MLEKKREKEARLFSLDAGLVSSLRQSAQAQGRPEEEVLSWLLPKRVPRLVNPTFNQIVRRLSLYCYDVPRAIAFELYSPTRGSICQNLLGES
jgi:hypothetical protein